MRTLCLLLTLLLALLTSCGRGDKRIELRGEAQGTYYSIIYYDSMGRDLQSSIDSLLDDFDQTASLWVDSSLIRRVNENRDSIVNPLFATLCRLSTEMNSYTEGCFDCTIGGLVKLWGFSFSKHEDVDDSAIDSLRNFVGLQPVITYNEDGTPIIHKSAPEVMLDFNAIAQGYCTDLIGHFLESHGIQNYLVDIGGEVFAKGTKGDGTPWTVGIERPAENKYSSPEIETTIQLHDLAVVTSGNYRKYYEKDGVRYSHTIDPSTGRPVTHTLLSVSVVDTVAWRADALATAFMVMGLDRALQFIEEHPDDMGAQTAFFIYDDGGHYSTYATERFKKCDNNSRITR